MTGGIVYMLPDGGNMNESGKLRRGHWLGTAALIITDILIVNIAAFATVVPFVVLVGEDEINEGVLSVKNMQTGEQVKLSPAAAAEHIAAVIKERNSGAVIKE